MATRKRKFNPKLSSTDPEQGCRLGLDSHADMSCVGKHAKILERLPRTAMVSGFTTELGNPLRVPIVTAAIAYEDEYSGKVYTLVIHNALYLKNMEVNLIPPMMMRIAGLEVDECPKFLAKRPTENNHSIFFPTSDLRIVRHGAEPGPSGWRNSMLVMIGERPNGAVELTRWCRQYAIGAIAAHDARLTSSQLNCRSEAPLSQQCVPSWIRKKTAK